MATSSKITIQKGATFLKNITIRNKSTSLPLDITTYTVRFTAKKSIKDVDAAAVLSVDIIPASHTDPTNGKTTLSISSVATAALDAWTYVYDIKIDGATQMVSATWQLEVLDSVTIR